MTNANLEAANLTKAFLGATGEVSGYYVGTDLSGANLKEANFTGANISGTTLNHGVYFGGANVEEAIGLTD